MKAGFYLVVALFFLQLSLSGQVSIIGPPSGTMVGEYQLTHVALLGYEMYRNQNVYLEIEILDDHNGMVFKAQSARILIPSDISGLFRPNVFFDHRPDYGKSAPGIYLRNTGRFLNGRYRICYRLIEAATNNQIGVSCDENLINLGQIDPMLVYPSNSSKIRETRPHFSWTPLIPNTQEGTSYYFFLLNKNKAKSESQENLFMRREVILETNVDRNFLVFPSYLPALTPGNSYSWGIITKYHNRTIASTDIWTFTIEKSETANDDAPGSCVNPEYYTRASQVYMQKRDVMCIVWQNKDFRSKLEYFFNADSSNIRIKDLKPGTNYIVIDIPEQMRSGKLQFLTMDDGKKIKNLFFKSPE